MSDEERAEKTAFQLVAVGRPCAVCGPAIFWTMRSHHVVYQQHLPPEEQWNPRNALPICDDCHERHHNASRRIPLSALTETHWAFAREVLGEAADHYLSRRYGDG